MLHSPNAEKYMCERVTATVGLNVDQSVDLYMQKKGSP